jgi:hypothetical protein
MRQIKEHKIVDFQISTVFDNFPKIKASTAVAEYINNRNEAFS